MSKDRSQSAGARKTCTPTALPDPDDAPPPPPEGGRLLMSWSGGKDSAMALHALQNDPRYEVVGLLTTVSREFRRVSHHGVREQLLHAQAESIGLPLHKMYFGGEGDESETMAAFERAMEELLRGMRADDVFHVGYGDIFLADLRAYREQRLASVGMRGVFPLWDSDTRELLQRFTDDGYRAVVTCAEPIAKDLAGAELSSDLLDSWPDGVDPCGEHGEFHSFVHQGPIYRHPIAFDKGATIVRDGRHYTELTPTVSD